MTVQLNKANTHRVTANDFSHEFEKLKVKGTYIQTHGQHTSADARDTLLDRTKRNERGQGIYNLQSSTSSSKKNIWGESDNRASTQ
jgi:hypothetical protein